MPLNPLVSRKKSRGSEVALILFSIKAGSTTAGRPNPTTRMIVLGKIFLYQNISWMPTRDPFLLTYIEEEKKRPI
jgi:hypothetical protein